jgi:O-antigen ligase
LSFIIWVGYCHKNFQGWHLKNRIGAVLVGFYLVAVIFLLKSAAVSIILIITISLFIAYYLYKAKEQLSKKVLIPIVVIGAILVSALAMRAVGKIGSKASYFSYDLSQPGGGEWNALNLRLAKWNVAKTAISDHWVLGVGPGNLVTTLDKYYKNIGFDYALQLHYNPHNQFLHTFLLLGIGGAILLILTFGAYFIQSIKKKDSIMLLFILSFTLFSMSESTLAVNKGIVFFAVFLTFLSYLPNKSSYYFHDSSNQK